jgi:hypothetical protein
MMGRRKKTDDAKIAVIEPPKTLTNVTVQRRPGDVVILSGAFLGDLYRHYEEKGHKVIDHVLEVAPLEYFKALVTVSRVHRIDANVTHRDGDKPRTLEEILDRVEQKVGPEGRKRFMKYLAAAPSKS